MQARSHPLVFFCVSLQLAELFTANGHQTAATELPLFFATAPALADLLTLPGTPWASLGVSWIAWPSSPATRPETTSRPSCLAAARPSRSVNQPLRGRFFGFKFDTSSRLSSCVKSQIFGPSRSQWPLAGRPLSPGTDASQGCIESNRIRGPAQR